MRLQIISITTLKKKKKARHTRRQVDVLKNQGKKKDPDGNQRVELSDIDFKIAMLNMFKEKNKISNR